MSYLYDLIIAVLKQAKRDYLEALWKNNFHKINELETFFLSDYGQAMSLNNGEKIIQLCREKVNKKRKLDRYKDNVTFNRNNGKPKKDN